MIYCALAPYQKTKSRRAAGRGLMSYFMRTGFLLPISRASLLRWFHSSNAGAEPGRSGSFSNRLLQLPQSGQPRAGAPARTCFKNMPVQAILTALESGKMQAIAAGLSAAERTSRRQVSWRRGRGIHPAVGALFHQSSALEEYAPSWNGWGVDPTNSRYQSAKAAGLTAADVPKLKLKWAFGYPGVTTSFGTPTVFGGRIFVGAADGSVFSLNAKSGCIYWIYQSDGRRPHRPRYFDRRKDRVSQRPACVGARRQRRDGSAALEDPCRRRSRSLHQPEPRNWMATASTSRFPAARNRIAAADPKFPCCKGRGSMVALDAKTGKQIWRNLHHLRSREDDRQNQQRSRDLGTVRSQSLDFSHSSIPSVHAIYAGTGINYSQPGTKTSDSVMAFDDNYRRNPLVAANARRRCL